MSKTRKTFEKDAAAVRACLLPGMRTSLLIAALVGLDTATASLLLTPQKRK